MEQYEREHLGALRRIAPECMVLLKSNGDFPLAAPQKIALYGNGARHTLKGGRGSGDVNVEYFPSVEQGLENAGCIVTTKAWLDAYEAAYEAGKNPFQTWLREKIAAEGMDRLMENLSIVMPEPDYDIPLDGEGDTAIYVLARQCGEGVDRGAVPGDLFLSKTEIRDIMTLQKEYRKFLLVLNTACYVDISPVAAYIETVVLLSKGEIDSKKVRVEFSLEDMDMSGFQKGATYEQIKAYVLEHTGLKVSSLYISQIKRKCGLDVGQNYNLSKKEDAKVPKCPPEKEAAIRDALKYFQMI